MSNFDKIYQIQNDFYQNHYANLVSKGANSFYHKFTHKFVEKFFDLNDDFPIVLELGAGSGEHFPYVKHKFKKYISSDIRDVSILNDDPRLNQLVCDAADVPLETASVNRIIVTCLLHHLENPVDILQEMDRLIKPGGYVSILLPSDPGILYRFLRSISSERRLHGAGFENSRVLHAIEHRNHIQSLLEIIKFCFKNDEINIKSWPTRFKNFWNLNSFYSIQIKKSV